MKKYYLRIFGYVFLIFILVAAISYTCFNSWQKIHANVKEKEELQIKYDELLTTEDSLSDEVNKLQDPEYVAKYAREKYLYTKDGEIVIDLD